jgi:hypothetical protein
MHRPARGEPRVLYWFRTPPHVKVGRSAFDPDTIRLLEAQHPEITFDWNRMLKEPPQAPPPELDRRREAREAREARQARRRRAELRDTREEPAGAPEPEPELGPELEQEGPVLADVLAEESFAVAAAPATLVVDREAIPEETASDLVAGPAETHPLAEMLGSEGLMRLRARHAALLARMAEVPDDARRDALNADAALIDPDGWLTAEEARAGLDTYEARYEALRTALGAPRKRRRRRRGRRPAGSASPTAQPPEGPDAAPPGEPPDEAE